MNSLVSWIGFFLWFPSFSILNIGNGTSIQLVILLSFIFIIFNYKRLQINKNILLYFILLLFFLFIQMILLMSIYSEEMFLLKGIIFFSLSVFMIVIGYFITKNTSLFQMFLKGYLYGGYLSSSVAIAQIFFWKLLHKDFAIVSIFHNSASFSSIINNPDVISNGRAFAFMAEPSLLFIHLSSLLVLIIYLKKNLFIKILVFSAIFSTSSMGVFLVLPIIFLYYYYEKLYRFRKVIFTFILLFIISASKIIYESYTKYNIDEITQIGLSYDTNLLDRYSNLSTSVSFISRLTSIINATDMIIERPIIGWGVQSDGGKIYLSEHSSSVEENIGINSFLFSILVWFGLFSLIFIYPLIKFLRCKNISKQIELKKLLIFSGIISSIFSLSYFNVYYIWVLMGMSLIVLEKKTRKIYVNN